MIIVTIISSLLNLLYLTIKTGVDFRSYVGKLRVEFEDSEDSSEGPVFGMYDKGFGIERVVLWVFEFWGSQFSLSLRMFLGLVFCANLSLGFWIFLEI